MKTEYKGEKFLIRWDVKEEILFIETWGDHSKEVVKDFCVKFREFWKEFVGEKRVKIFIDASKSIKTNHEARRAYAELAKAEAFLAGGIVAVYGANILIKTIARFILAFVVKTGKVDIKFFATKEKALKWLKTN